MPLLEKVFKNDEFCLGIYDMVHLRCADAGCFCRDRFGPQMT